MKNIKIKLVGSFTLLNLTCANALADNLVAYVSNKGDDTVSMILLDNFQVLDTIPVGHGPAASALTADGTRLYVANSLAGTVSVLDTLSHSVIGTIPVGNTPSALAVSPDSTHVYVANSGSANVSVIGTASNIVENTFATALTPSSIACHPQRNEIWLGFNALPGTALSVFSSDSFVPLASLNSSSSRYASSGLQFRPDGSSVFGTEACGCCGRFHEISGAISSSSLTILHSNLFLGGDFAVGVAVHPSNGKVFFVQQGNCSVPPTPHVSELGGANRILHLTQNPQALAISPDGNQLCVVGSASLIVIDTVSFTTITNIAVGNGPDGIALGRVNLSPTLTVAIADLQLCWNSASNTQYQVEYRSELTSNSWQPLGGAILGNGVKICTTDSILGQPRRFYRVRLVQ